MPGMSRGEGEARDLAVLAAGVVEVRLECRCRFGVIRDSLDSS